MATVDRIEPGYTAWTPSSARTATDDEPYRGRHRVPELGKVLSWHRAFHRAKHRVS